MVGDLGTTGYGEKSCVVTSVCGRCGGEISQFTL